MTHATRRLIERALAEVRYALATTDSQNRRDAMGRCKELLRDALGSDVDENCECAMCRRPGVPGVTRPSAAELKGGA